MRDRHQLRRHLLGLLDTDEPIVIRMRHEPAEHAQRLLVTLGAGWIVDPRADPCVRRCGHPGCRVNQDWQPNWIDYRASLARIDRRLEAHEEVPTCEHCDCETDVQPVPHSPRCPVVTGENSTRDEEEPMRDDAGLAALEAMDNGEPQMAAQRPNGADAAAPFKACKIEGCTEDASDAPRMGRLAGKCARHRDEARAAQSAGLTGKPRGGGKAKAKAKKASPPRVAARNVPPPPPAASTNGSVVSKAERLLACARAVDELQAQLEAARTDLKEAAEALL